MMPLAPHRPRRQRTCRCRPRRGRYSPMSRAQPGDWDDESPIWQDADCVWHARRNAEWPLRSFQFSSMESSQGCLRRHVGGGPMSNSRIAQGKPFSNN